MLGEIRWTEWRTGFPFFTLITSLAWLTSTLKKLGICNYEQKLVPSKTLPRDMTFLTLTYIEYRPQPGWFWRTCSIGQFGQVFLFLIFFKVGTLCGVHLLTTFYGLYFNHQLHIKLKNFFKFSSEGSFHVLHLYLFSLKNFCPCQDLNLRTSPVPSRYATNLAILALIS